MIEENTPLPVQEPRGAVAIALPQPPKKLSRPARKGKPAKSAKPRLQKFDMVLLEMLKEGKSDAQEIRGIFNVDEAEFQKRVHVLLRRKLIVADANMRAIRLSVAGVNGYKPEWKKLADAWLARIEEKPANAQEPAAAIAAPAQITPPEQDIGGIQAKLELDSAGAQAKAQDEKPVHPTPEPCEKPERMDLEEVIKKYGPNESQRRERRKASPFLERVSTAGNQEAAKSGSMPRGFAISAANELPAASNKRHGPAAETEEKCELCKSAFSVSVRATDNNPKYGHCFCGAAYHKDCFDAVLEGEKKCVRCGRKLALTLDLKGEEAISGITDIST
ncbi:MAG: hypothetical protein V1708_00655 [Candidatus Micrarchaeota archaeon]